MVKENRKIYEMRTEILAMLISNIVGIITFCLLITFGTKYFDILREYVAYPALIYALYLIIENYRNISRTFNKLYVVTN